MGIYELIDHYQMLLEEKGRLEEAKKANTMRLMEARDQLAQAMIEEESPKVSRCGFLFSLQAKTKYSKAAGHEEQLFEVLREEGLGDLIQETVNAQTLQGAMSSLVEERGELPEELEDLINVYEYFDVARRKETNRAAAAAKQK